VEIGPRSALLGLVPGCLPEVEASLVATLKSGREETASALEALGSYWANGGAVEWKGVFPTGGRRVELPTYAWQRERYWVDVPAMPVAAGETSVWPLAGTRIRTPGDGLHHVLTVGARHQVYLADHVVFGRVVVPGAYHVAVALAVGAAQWPDSALEVSDVELLRPVTIGPGEQAELHVMMSREEQGEAYQFEVATYSKDEEVWSTHARGRIAPGGSEATGLPAPSELEAEAREEVDVATVFDGLAAANVQWGPQWRWMRNGRKSARGAVAELAPPYAGAHGAGPLHPGLLDNGFGVALLAMPGRGQDGTPFLPFAIQRLRWLRIPVGAVRCGALPRGEQGSSADVVTADLVFWDESGAVVAQVEGFTARKAPREAFLRELRGASRDVYRLDWREVPLGPSAGLSGRWVLVASQPTATTAALQEKLGGCSVSDPDGLKTYLDSEPSVTSVLCLWEPKENENSAATARRVAIEQLSVVQALRGREGLRLWSVTRGAVAVEVSERVSPAASTAWGLCRTVMQEEPDLRCTLVDLGPDEPLENLLRELEENDGESQVALRTGRRQVPRLVRAEALRSEGGALPVRQDGTVLITGGLGALGLEVARWFARQGVGHLLLTSRRGMSTPGAETAVEELSALGARVTVAGVDVADRQGLASMLLGLPDGYPLRGVVHAAGLLDDGTIGEQSAERFRKVLEPKVEGAWNLHRVTEEVELDFFVLFSSVAGMLGSPGQSGYAAGNAFLDALAASRRAKGLPGQSLAWGAWAESGMAGNLGGAQQARLARRGMKALSAEEGLALFGEALLRPEAQLGVARLDLAAVGRSFGAEIPSVWRVLLRAPATRGAADTAGVWAKKLAALPAEKRLEEVRSVVQSEVARVLSLSNPGLVATERPLQELGLDSLMAVELRNALKQRVGRALPATLAYDYPTIEALSRWLMEQVAPDAAQGAPGEGTGAWVSDVEIRSALAAVSISELRRAGLLGKLLELARRTPAADSGAADLDEMSAEDLINMFGSGGDAAKKQIEVE
jgi:acyl transferase domain-containing protein/acyl carrier protein